MSFPLPSFLFFSLLNNTHTQINTTFLQNISILAFIETGADNHEAVIYMRLFYYYYCLNFCIFAAKILLHQQWYELWDVQLDFVLCLYEFNVSFIQACSSFISFTSTQYSKEAHCCFSVEQDKKMVIVIFIAHLYNSFLHVISFEKKIKKKSLSTVVIFVKNV